MPSIEIEGVKVFEEELHGCNVTTVRIQSEQAAEKLGKPVGSYITIETGESLNEHTNIVDIGECLTEVLGRVMQSYYHGKLCVCGIGNDDLSADALGPETVHNLPLKVLSGIGTEGNFREVCSIVPGVAGTNNINTEVIVGGVVKAIGADCVLLVDSLTTKDPSWLFQTIQISTAGGLSPHLSGRDADWSALGVPVISLGVPMTIPLAAFSSHQDPDHKLFTSTEVQSVVVGAGRIIAYAILRMCWPVMSKAECFVFSGLNRNPIPNSLLLEAEDEQPEPA